MNPRGNHFLYSFLWASLLVTAWVIITTGDACDGSEGALAIYGAKKCPVYRSLRPWVPLTDRKPK